MVKKKSYKIILKGIISFTYRIVTLFIYDKKKKFIQLFLIIII